MPRTLKRRSDAISRDDSPASNPPTNDRRRRRSASASSDASLSNENEEENVSDPDEQSLTQARTTHATFVKKLVRLALATEYARQPLRRADVSTKIFKEAGVSGRGFKGVFNEAQRTLERVFGMKLVELPGREKMGIKERRVAATQATQAQMGTQKRGKGKQKESQGVEGAGAGGQGKSWILVSVLPEKYENNPEIVRPAKAPSQDAEAGYTALYTFVVAVVYLNGNELAEGKLERYMEQVNVGRETEWGSWEKVLARMVREGYLDRRREEGEGWVYVVGPRGKVEVGAKGVQGLVKTVYGVGEGRNGDEAEGRVEGNRARANGEMDEEELNKRLTRSLGVSVGEKRETFRVVDGAAEGGNEEQPEPHQRRRSGRRRGGARDDNDDDDDD